jgi:hypothetical protein
LYEVRHEPSSRGTSFAIALRMVCVETYCTNTTAVEYLEIQTMVPKGKNGLHKTE